MKNDARFHCSIILECVLLVPLATPAQAQSGAELRGVAETKVEGRDYRV